MKIYVGCGLAEAPEEFRLAVEGLRQKIMDKGHKVFGPMGLTVGTARQAYEWNIKHCVAKCDLFIAICDYLSTELGYELASAVEKHSKRVIAVTHENSIMTRLILGIDHPNFCFRTYTELEEVAGFIAEMVQKQSAQREFDWEVVAV
ncbi:MAG: hypothetical protein AAB392_02055 [Patescibacteria group bacterium]